MFRHDDAWYALYTRPRMEESAQHLLLAKGYRVFLPKYTKRQMRGRSVCEVATALFPSYLFCHLTDESVGRMISTPGIARIVGIGGVPARIPEEEIENIRRLTDSRIGCIPCTYLREGCRIRVTSGPLASAEGVLVRTNRGAGLIASIEILHRSVHVALDPDWKIAFLAPVEAAV
jgi:transcriptional antiterminator RfaH